MSFDLPVVAYNAAAVPETLGTAGVLLDSKEPELWSVVIEELRHNQEFRAAVVANQRERFSELSVDGTKAKLLELISGLGECSPIRVSRPTLQVQGPFETSYSLAGVNRNLALALDQKNGFDTSIYCTEGAGDYSPSEADLADKPSSRWLWRKSQMLSENPSVTIRNLYPPRVGDVTGGLNFLYFYWEDSLVRADWIAEFNRHLDAVLAPTQFVRRVLVESGLTIPCHVIGVGVEDRFFQSAADMAVDRGNRPFTFLNVGSGFARKGIDLLLAAYFTEFTASENVQLVIKTFPNVHNDVADQVAAWHDKMPSPPACVHIDSDIPRDAMDQLYTQADCLAYPTRAEGFGLPIAEAMARKIPVIVTGYSGPMDFCSEETAWMLDYEIVPSRSHLAVPGAGWAEPRIDQLREQMRHIYGHRDSVAVTAKVEAAFKNIKQNFRWSQVADRVQDIAARALPTPALKLAMVTTWDCRCGIAEYSRYLIDAVARGQRNLKVEVLSAPGEGVWTDNGTVNTTCWGQRPSTDLSRLRSHVLDHGFDIVHFQFNFAFFDLQELASIIRDFKRAGKKVVLTFHSTADVPEPHGSISLRTIADPLRSVDLLLVHSSQDEERLASWGVTDNVRILPHGNLIYPSQDRSLRKQWGITLDPVISTFGFLLPHKGILELLDAVRILREDFPNLGLMAQCALHRDGVSRAFEPVVRQRISDLRLEQCVMLSTHFVAPEEAMLFLQLSDLVVLPYKETRESSSASVRFALGSGRPVITTKNPIFSDVRDSTMQVETSCPEDLAAAIRVLLTSPLLAEQLAERALKFAGSTNWNSVADQYVDYVLSETGSIVLPR